MKKLTCLFVALIIVSAMPGGHMRAAEREDDVITRVPIEQTTDNQAEYRELHQNEPYDITEVKPSATSLAASAQTALTITSNDDPNDLLGAFLVENTGITITGVGFTGASTAAGLYTGGPLNIEDGIILATGRVTSALPPDNSPSTSTNLHKKGCSWCNDLIPGYSSYDAAILEITFDAAPSCSSITFNFVFGSEEYPEWVGTAYNDVFGVYLNDSQIAFDDGGAPITINGPFFSGDFVQTPPDNGLEYDGATFLLRTTATVVPGSNDNTLIFAICDAGDRIYDSGVFLAKLEGSGPSNPCTGIPPQFDHPPMPACGETLYVAVDELVTFDVQASDVGPNIDTVTITVDGLPAGAAMNPPLPITGDPVTSTFSWTPTAADAGVHTLVFHATDLAPCYFNEQCSIVLVVDDTPPAITCPADTDVECGASTDPSSTGYPTVSDDYDDNPIVTYADQQNGNVLLRTWTATDDAGNSAECVQTITLLGHDPALASDTTDYQPGETVYLEGYEFCANELIDIWVEILGESGTAICDGLWTVTADEFGSFSTDWFVCEQASGESLVVFATGQTAQVTTSLVVGDCNTILDIISIPSSVAPYASFQVTARLVQKCADGSLAPLVNRDIHFFLTEGNCGVDVGQTADAIQTTDVNGDATVTLTAPAADFGVRAKFLGEGKPKPCPSPGNSACNPLYCVNLSASNDCDPITVSVPCDLAITCPSNVTIECNESTDPSNTGTATATGNCPPNNVTYSDQTTAGACAQEYTITRTWTATDASSNTEQCVQTITVEDNTAPVISCPANVTIECDESTDPANTGNATATDNCDASPVVSYGDSQVGDVITRTWTATDACGNSAQCQQTITLDDTTAPIITCPANVTIECSASTDPANTGSATATDNCDATPAITYSDSEAAGSCAQEKTITRTWTATDASSNSTQCVQTITVEDNTAPMISCPADVTIECDASTDPSNTGNATATDNCDPSPTVSYSDNPTGNGITRTWTAVDDCGNNASCQQTITLEDTTPPVITCPADATVECDQSTAPGATGYATATDNCDGTPTVTYADTETAGSCAQEKTITRTWTAVDDDANSAQCVQTITVVDNTAPVITCPANVTIECSASTDPSSTGSATAADNCDPSPAVTHSDSQAGDVITRTWTATDACGNSSQCQQTITLEDTTPPSISCPANTTIECDQSSDPSSTGYATATDNCDASPVVTYADYELAGMCDQEKTITRTWTATDADLNTAQCIQTITVVDNTAPAVTCPANVTVECDQSTDPSSTGYATASDNCDPAPSVTYSDQQVGGTITRTWTATDDCGNSGQCQQTITIEDTTPPAITCPANTTIECDQSSDPSNTGYATATDNCDGTPTVTYSDSEAPGACPQEKTITRTWTATDDALNSAQCVQTISVVDDTAPVLSVPVDVFVECDESTAPANTGTATASDNCDPLPSVTYSDSQVGDVITRTWTATDACGNSSQQQQTITVVDTTPPAITCPVNVTINCDESTDPSNTGTATASDNCDPSPTVTYSDAETAGSCPQEKTITRTWTATDADNNSAQCTQIITVLDNTAPVITCPANVTVECDESTAPANTGSATASDNCDTTPTVTYGDQQTGNVITRTWTATDDCGNSAQCQQTITIQDTTPPVVTCPANVTVACNTPTDPSATGSATATDNCDATPSISYSDVVTAGSCPQEKTITRTWTATDDALNSAQCVQTITVEDNIAPALYGCPGNVTVECDAIPAAPTVTATDNCDPAPSVNYTETSNLNGCGAYTGTITRTWTATDACGNQASCSQTITVIDNTDPVITCPANVTIQCDESTAPANTGSATAADNCDTSPTVTYSDSEVAGACAQEKTITRTWTATDACGNQATCQQTITVIDDTDPVLSGCPANVTVECDAIPTAATVTATDNCDPAPTVTYNETSTLTGCGGYTGTITRTWTATDDCGNQASCSQTITVIDNTPPVITCPANATLECDDSTDPSNTGTATATDNCDTSPTVTYSDAQSNGTITRTWTATDACGNSAQCTQTITIDDTTPPVITCPANTTVECGQSTDPSNTGYATATDNCDSSPTITWGDSRVGSVITRTWTATDDGGNSSQCQQTITIEDTTPPSITCPAAVTIECDESSDPANTGTATATDDCDTSPVVTYADSEAAGTCDQAKTITRTWTATDAASNSAQCTQTITVVDNTAPVITCPANITVECDESTDPANTGSATATDNCDPAPVITYTDSETAGSCADEKTITRTWTATDDCGNSDQCLQTITVVDDTAPVITCPANVTIECDESTAPANTGSATATDNCDSSPSVTYSDSEAAGSCAQNKTITRTWTATDDCGNSAQCAQTITVLDTEAPQLTCPPNATVECDNIPTAPTVSATDNCDPSPTVAFNETSNLTGCGGYTGTITRTWTATDACGNQNSCSQILTVVDNTPPAIVCPANVTIECDESTNPSNTGAATATDCDANPSITYGDQQTGGTITRTWTATDDCGNSAQCIQTITVEDTTPPVITCPDDATIDCTASTNPSNTGSATATDNCDSQPSITYSDVETAGICAQEKTITRTWTATDDALNSAQCVQTITVVDNTAPAITCPASLTINCDESLDPSNTGSATATDNCDPSPAIDYSDSETAGACPQEKTVTRTWTATDACGNQSDCQQIITVVDNVDPALAGYLPDATVECDNIPTPANVTATDNCDPSPNVSYNQTTDLSGCGGYTGTITRTWTATDACGNQSTHTRTLTVVDNTDPVIACPADVTVECDESTAPANTGSATATDNCDPSPAVTYSDYQNGNTITRTWTATDACGNSDQCDQVITIEDTTPPEITCPANLTISCAASIDPSNTGTATATDNCDQTPAITYADTETPGSCQQEKTITRTWTATDDDNNSAQCVQIITVVDNVAPVLAGCPSDMTIECDESPTPANVTASDNCDPSPTVTFAEVVDLSGCGGYTGTITWTWTATDACGNSASCSQVITVVDTHDPVVSCPDNATVQCGESTDPANTGTATATDDCDTSPTVTYADVETAGSCPQEKTITRTWTATDACGNDASCVQTITVVDNTDPVLIGCPNDITIECDDAVPAPANVTATDNCDPSPSVSLDETPDYSGCGGYTGTITRTWTATDACGNSTSCSQTITIVDTQAPVTTCPADITVECIDDIPLPDTLAVTAIDNCDPKPMIILQDETYDGQTCPLTVTRVYRAIDACGNHSDCIQVITVDDTVDPVITCPGNATAQCLDEVPACDAGLASATDNCDYDVAITCDRTDNGGAGCASDPLVITDTYTATDDCGNTATCQQTITVVDDTVPVLAGCPANETVQCDAIPDPPTVTATDNCDDAPVVDYNEIADLSGPGGYTGTVTRTWTATDFCGNEASCVQVITVIDDVGPLVIGCPNDTTVQCDAIPSAPTLTATDNCDQAPAVAFSETEDFSSGCGGYTGTVTRTWTATDAVGNQTVCMQTVTVADTLGPVIDCPQDVTVECGDPTDPTATGEATATDNCDQAPGVTFADVETQGSYPQEVFIARTWTASDACGNQSSCHQEIHVVDSNDPSLVVPPDQTHHWTDGPQTLQATATDACVVPSELTYSIGCVRLTPPGASASSSVDGIEIDANTGVITYTPGCLDVTAGPCLVTVRVEDPAGNSDEGSFTITVTNTPPAISCPADIPEWYSYQGEIRESFTAGDPNSDPITVSVLSTKWFGDPVAVPGGMSIEGAYEFVWSPGWLEEGQWEITLQVDDGCQQMTCAFNINIAGSWRVGVTDEPCVLPGYNASVFITMTNPLEMGGFDFLLSYDPSGLEFLGAEPWNEIIDWEYFTYRHSANSNCGEGCPSGQIRVIGIANLPDGSNPPEEVYLPEGKIVKLTFATTDDRSFIGQCFWIDWLWFDCGDNSISSRLGDTMYVSQDIERLLPEEDCLAGFQGKDIEPQAVLDFSDGSICICPPPDDRGDINLNGLANEISDAVLFANYFVYGPEVLGYGIDDYYENRVLATDINDDGIVLTVADLVYLIRIITGDANPYPESGEGGFRVAPYVNSVEVNYSTGDNLIVSSTSTVDVGAAAFVLEYSDTEIGLPVLSAGLEGMTIRSSASDGELRILVYSTAGNRIPAGSYPLLTIPLSGTGTVELALAQFSDAGGNLLDAMVNKVGPPAEFQLSQNYPNPFNAGTMIQFALPDASDWNLRIYNIVGRLVEEFSGSDNAGYVSVRWDARDAASGIYFYKLTAGSHTATRKMILMK